MKPSPKNLAALITVPCIVALAIAAPALLGRAQPSQSPSATQTQPAAAPAIAPMNRRLVVLDPAHGGPDAGAALDAHLAEKDVTLALAARLRTALTAAGFTVVMTRDADPSDLLTTDQRAETANRSHALACLVFHGTATGSGVHVYTSLLQPPVEEDAAAGDSPDFVPVPWGMAQAGSVRQSVRLANGLSAALGKASVPTVVRRAPVRPLDNLMCPAVAIELARSAGDDATTIADPDYQQRVVTALTAALLSWRDQAEPQKGAQ